MIRYKEVYFYHMAKLAQSLEPSLRRKRVTAFMVEIWKVEDSFVVDKIRYCTVLMRVSQQTQDLKNFLSRATDSCYNSPRHKISLAQQRQHFSCQELSGVYLLLHGPFTNIATANRALQQGLSRNVYCNGQWRISTATKNFCPRKNVQ